MWVRGRYDAFNGKEEIGKEDGWIELFPALTERSSRHSPLKLRSRVAALRGHTDMMADKRGHKDA